MANVSATCGATSGVISGTGKSNKWTKKCGNCGLEQPVACKRCKNKSCCASFQKKTTEEGYWKDIEKKGKTNVTQQKQKLHYRADILHKNHGYDVVILYHFPGQRRYFDYYGTPGAAREFIGQDDKDSKLGSLVTAAFERFMKGSEKVASKYDPSVSAESSSTTTSHQPDLSSTESSSTTTSHQPDLSSTESSSTTTSHHPDLSSTKSSSTTTSHQPDLSSTKSSSTTPSHQPDLSSTKSSSTTTSHQPDLSSTKSSSTTTSHHPDLSSTKSSSTTPSHQPDLSSTESSSNTTSYQPDLSSKTNTASGAEHVQAASTLNYTVALPSGSKFKMTDNDQNVFKAICVLAPRTIIHGHPVLPGHVVVRVLEVLSSLKPVTRGGPDEDEDVVPNAYYQWPLDKLFVL